MAKVIGVTTGADGHTILRPGAVTSIGSLPHTDAHEAAAFVLAAHPVLPAAPQLPRRSPLEGMIAQAVRHLPGVTVAADGALSVDLDALDPAAVGPTTIDGPSHRGLLAFLDAVAGRTAPVKLQLTGPVTVARALFEAGAPRPLAIAVAAAGVRAYADALLSLVREKLPEAPLLVLVDEPGLARTMEGPSGEVDVEEVVDHLSSVLAVLEEHAVTGVHCCGPTDWQMPSAAGATVLAMPVEHDWVLASAGAINAHLDRGGWIAWGVVPTHEPLGADPDRLWRRLSATWCELVQAGCDPIELRTQALVTPACGLAGHGVSQAAHALHLASDIAARVTDQAVAVRLSAGA
jgi:methionine synthase II (cobalamin-independent)